MIFNFLLNVAEKYERLFFLCYENVNKCDQFKAHESFWISKHLLISTSDLFREFAGRALFEIAKYFKFHKF